VASVTATGIVGAGGSCRGREDGGQSLAPDRQALDEVDPEDTNPPTARTEPKIGPWTRMQPHRLIRPNPGVGLLGPAPVTS